MGKLYIVATPIGNLGDMTYRGVEVLRGVDRVVAEDTRKVRRIFEKYGIGGKRVESFHGYSGEAKKERIVRWVVEEGSEVALVSEAGTPGVSDPGVRLVRGVVEAGGEVIPIPGVSAVVTALSVSGMGMASFKYYGFLPIKKGRQRVLDEIGEEGGTVVIYEAPHRLRKTLGELGERCGEREIMVGREMTKMYEEYLRGTVEEVCEHFEKVKPRGEFTLVLGEAGKKKKGLTKRGERG